MTYKVQLPVFEGPLDLLLYLIKKDEINIYDIPIAKITDQYLEYLKVMELLDLEIAGEFILMAATLIHIKSKMLLPLEPKDEEDIMEEPDPREELVKRLLEYKKFKEAAGNLKEMQLRQKDSFARVPAQATQIQNTEEEEGFEASLFDLITAFTKILKEVPKDIFHQVLKDEFTVSDKIHDILHLLVERTKVCFNDLFYTEDKSARDGRRIKPKNEIVAIFLALLELVKLKEVVVIQRAPFSEIEIMKNAEWQRS
ncbi:MAG: segregation/condensation protein A [Candidatus Omnitrophica bacterium]|nr:segregation/condensation protein A [Candidatus Omnitrophota bacterium]